MTLKFPRSNDQLSYRGPFTPSDNGHRSCSVTGNGAIYGIIEAPRISVSNDNHAVRACGRNRVNAHVCEPQCWNPLARHAFRGEFSRPNLLVTHVLFVKESLASYIYHGHQGDLLKIILQKFSLKISGNALRRCYADFKLKGSESVPVVAPRE